MIDSCRGNTYSNIRDKLILMILFDLGIRVSELTHLKFTNVKEEYILIKGQGEKERLLYVSPILKRHIMKYNRAKRKRFSHKKKNEHAKVANVREKIGVSPHTCRHYFLRNGIDIYSLSRLMEHYDTNITSDYLRGLQDAAVLKKGFNLVRCQIYNKNINYSHQ